RRLEEQFVVDLEQHARLEAAGTKLVIDADHCQLDQIGGGALKRGVDGGAFGEAAGGGGLGGDIGNGAHAAKQSPDPVLSPCLFQHLIDEASHALVLLEIRVDELLGLALLDAKLLR